MLLHADMCLNRRPRAISLAIPLVASLAGCGYLSHAATVEPYPHPFVRHRELPFDAPTLPAATRTLRGVGRLFVADLDSQAVLPVGCHMQEGEVSWYPLLCGIVIPLYDTGLLENVRPAELDYGTADMADTLGAELAACGADVVRRPGDAHPRLFDAASVGPSDHILRGTLDALEHGRHGYAMAPYDFVHMTLRIRLYRAADAALVWQGDVAVGRKLASGEGRAMATQALQLVARRLAADPAFQQALATGAVGP